MELKTNDWILEYRQMQGDGTEKVRAKYFVAKDGTHVSLVPVNTFFGNHDLLDNLDFWIKAIDEGMKMDRDVTLKSLSGDLRMLQFVLANITPERAESERLAWEHKAKKA